MTLGSPCVPACPRMWVSPAAPQRPAGPQPATPSEDAVGDGMPFKGLQSCTLQNWHWQRSDQHVLTTEEVLAMSPLVVPYDIFMKPVPGKVDAAPFRSLERLPSWKQLYNSSGVLPPDSGVASSSGAGSGQPAPSG